MTSKRLALTLACMLAAVLAAVSAAAAADDHGGAAVTPWAESQGGGVLAPGETGEVAASQSDAAEDGGAGARVAQDPTPTTPEGEEQPDGAPDESDEGIVGPIEELPEDGAGAAPGAEGGGLPQSGLMLAALAAIGLGLLLAGAALWPTSSWPPPRDRLSRSTPRR
jgi:hypothetical protein